jgi:hypothetical protein
MNQPFASITICATIASVANPDTGWKPMLAESPGSGEASPCQEPPLASPEFCAQNSGVAHAWQLREISCGPVFLCPLPPPGLIPLNSFALCFQRPRPRLLALKSFRSTQKNYCSGCRCPIGRANLQACCMAVSAWFLRKPLPVCMPAGISICLAPFRSELKLMEAIFDPLPTVISWRKRVSFAALPN